MRPDTRPWAGRVPGDRGMRWSWRGVGTTGSTFLPGARRPPRRPTSVTGSDDGGTHDPPPAADAWPRFGPSPRAPCRVPTPRTRDPRARDVRARPVPAG